jgi:hypothetical protein
LAKFVCASQQAAPLATVKCRAMDPDHTLKILRVCLITYPCVTDNMKLSQQQYTMKSSQMISHVNVDLASDISEAVSVTIIRG